MYKFPKVIKRKDRDDAILICAIAASNEELREAYSEAARNLGILGDGDGDDSEQYDPTRPTSWHLALAAWDAVDDLRHHLTHHEVDAEAEALLRSGWNPGEPVEVLK